MGYCILHFAVFPALSWVCDTLLPVDRIHILSLLPPHLALQGGGHCGWLTQVRKCKDLDIYLVDFKTYYKAIPFHFSVRRLLDSSVTLLVSAHVDLVIMSTFLCLICSCLSRYQILFVFFVSILFSISLSSLFWYHIWLLLHNR